MCNPPIQSTHITKPVFCDACSEAFAEFGPKWSECKAKLLGQPLTAGQLEQERKDRVKVLTREVFLQGLTEGPATCDMTAKIKEANELTLGAAQNLAELINRKRHCYEYDTMWLEKTGGMTEENFKWGAEQIKASEEKFELDIDQQFTEQRKVLWELNSIQERSEEFRAWDDDIDEIVEYI
ncbi:hypothetical protein NPX13_g4455 [Xylaria arbuscula]|uniref:Uncharacterized protein n=1 Tax=Xylaria arbuscula TaxID=114810 RepID=A0A9W8TLX6_9PEZI|nr:hypothetical protein NPX13_g4455 [Xylaria arbuscula]